MPGPREVDFIETLSISLPDSKPGDADVLVEEEEMETPPGSSPEKKPKDGEPPTGELPVPAPSPEPEPKPKKTEPEIKKWQEGESPRERARILEIERLKRQLRTERVKKLVSDDQPTVPVQPSMSAAKLEKLKEKYSEEDLKGLQDVFGAFAEDMGFVNRNQFQETTYQQSAS